MRSTIFLKITSTRLRFAALGGPVFRRPGLAAGSVLCADSVLEGEKGITSGKWVAGIRVLGTDLRPCGVGRALVCNLLKMVDGFFNFMVGIMVAALSENWQRVGDMAARTVVIDVRSRGQSVTGASAPAPNVPGQL
ncbi:MAG TPA: RDD family protein [Desulfobacterales bacterium]